MTPAIEVSHLTKEYRLGAMTSLREGLRGLGARLRGRVRPLNTPFKALDDVSFSVQPGEVVGVIGHNGAGKSTLLKMISRITTPTRGSVKVNGRIAPLIEVGAGFVGDFTGRENVYLNGAILGLKRKEIERKFDEIVAFAEMEEFIDTPIKRYSSGMQVKLAFAVATSIESEILIVDEVLAVGDIAFQRKCFDRMEDLIKRQGRTVLLVSHNLRQVSRLCSRAVLLDRGRVSIDGAPAQVCDAFFEQADARIRQRVADSPAATRHLTTGAVEVLSVRLLDSGLQPLDTVSQGRDVYVSIDLLVNEPLKLPVFAIGFHTPDLLYLASHRSEAAAPIEELPCGRYTLRCGVRRLPFLAGVLSIRASVAAGSPRVDHFYGENLYTFQVLNDVENRADMANEGFVALDASWEVAGGTTDFPSPLKTQWTLAQA